MRMRAVFLPLMVLLLGTLLTACGFQLRGQAPVFATVSLTSTAGMSELAQIIRSSWQAQGIHFVSVKNSDFKVQLLKESNNHYIMSGFNSSSSTQQYQVVETLYFAILDKKGNYLVKNGQLSASALATQNNTQQYNPDLIESLRSQLASQLLWRLGALKA
ncbi:lipopolysaccharide-assembly family protein [Piscirickettsia salmonis]|uniref:Lipopolysaccharide-assembly n=2 Tax=Piscirickettsia salmonis TaxID=1238 RepID=A0A9Q5VK59_PISSA|nr:LPS-assembly family protein [Piscirickettsia salmonis]RNC78999.1 lipopolysaccharide-assembly family protein [Piscirickettsiaceae bacterium NZ-RLO2]ALA23857.1 lipopolysaccharide-assembly family protein [Piscirickettsia salmonis]APS44278.1 lipopolysaccharide-assembly family protein [Piscirickettsia salmonis]APS47638.1 lipopolysaccharide-assembly family protein [Piscirickettsia salmonis]APS50929.1 lipopolysaccharide-assembly family protein [Piscirickettsia salmonis]